MKPTDLKAGDCLTHFEHWGCLPYFARRKVLFDPLGLPFVNCKNGWHYLDGQVDKNEELIACKVEPKK